MVNLAIFASGKGSNFEAIVKFYAKKRRKKVNIKFLLTDVKDAYVRHRAKRLGIKDIFIDPAKFNNKREFEDHIIELLKKEGIDLIVLAGFMRILSPFFVRKFPYKILNIHPSLLPAFKGKEAIVRAYNYGIKVTGVTVHFVDEKIDHGPIILQESIKIKDRDSLSSLERKIHSLEHKLYPKAIELVINKRLNRKGRRIIARPNS